MLVRARRLSTADPAGVLGGVVTLVKPVTVHEVFVLELDGGLVTLAIRVGTGEEDLPVRGPIDDAVVDELGSVIDVQPGHLERECTNGLSERGLHVHVRGVARLHTSL